MYPRTIRDCLLLLAACGLLTWSLIHATSAEITTLVNFNGTNGANPYAGLYLASDGCFYGTTHQGGTNGVLTGGLGTVFRMTADGQLTVLSSFGPHPNGTKPYATLAQALDGNLYGTTWQGGTAGSGTFFRITTNGNYTSLLTFSGANGSRPSARLLLGDDGLLYGTTQLGGANNFGTIFRVSTNGVLTTIVSFNSANGANPYSELYKGPHGHFYGTTVNGGVSNLGTIYQLTTNGVLTTLASFTGINGASPFGGVVADASGVLYGTTAYGGESGFGTVFSLTTNGVLTTLHSFAGGPDGDNPRASLLLGRDGRLYGTTTLGGAILGATGWGTIFQITTNGQLTLLATFDYNTNGISPYCSLIQDANGNIYGTTFSQGLGLKGTVFRLNPSRTLLQPSLQGNNSFQLTWEAWPGLAYQVQYKTNSSQPDWSNLITTLNATNGVMSVSDSISPNDSRFYRVRQLTSP